LTTTAFTHLLVEIVVEPKGWEMWKPKSNGLDGRTSGSLAKGLGLECLGWN
jgi:hypothetical protein